MMAQQFLLLAKWVDAMYRLQVFGDAQKCRDCDTDDDETFYNTNHAQLSMRASRISPTTALEF
jgi:hypothetical protein